MKTGSWMAIAMVMLTAAAAAAAPAPLKVKVLKNSVNLRAQPVPTAEVVGQVAANDILISKSMNKEWVELVPPTNVDFWVFGDFVKDGVIKSQQKVNIRSGAGINFAIVGKLAPGDKVVPRGTMTEWARIAPPENCSVWVSRTLVEVVVDKPAKTEPAKVEPVKAEPVKAEPVKAALVVKPEEQAAPKPAAPKAAERANVFSVSGTNATGAATEQTDAAAQAQEQKAVPGVVPPGLDLIPSKGQGQWKQYDGVLRTRGIFFRTPTHYRLMTYDKDGKGTMVCYVKGNSDQLSTLVDRPMIISGREYWVQKQTHPVLAVDRIVLK